MQFDSAASAQKQTEGQQAHSGAGPDESSARRYNNREGGDSRRGNYRGNRPYDPTRGGGRGSYRGARRGGAPDNGADFGDIFRKGM